MTDHDPAWVPCTHPECSDGIRVHWRHIENFTDRFYCPAHDHDDEVS